MNICFIGGGNMATALIGGLLKGKFYVPEELRAVEINADNRTKLQSEFGIHTSADLTVEVKGSNIIVLAVKPQQLRTVCAQLSPLINGQLIVSIAAGIRASDISRWLGTPNVVRCMPNTPALVGKGVTGLYALPKVSDAHQEIAGNILRTVGSIWWLKDEVMLDSVTAISGSGPAYVFYFIEAMQQAARELGFTETQAKSLVIDTFFGAVKLADESKDDVSVLRARVTSKNGTTERALLSMEANHVNQHIITAVKAAAARSREMGDELGQAT